MCLAMDKKQIIKAITEVCNIVENIIGDVDKTVNVGCILTGDNIDLYRIERIDKSCDNKIAVCVRFHTICSNTWHGKYYFVSI